MEIKLPPTYADLNLRQLSVLNSSEDTFIRLEACSGLSTKELRVMPMNLINEASEYLRTLQEAETMKHLPVIELSGNTYGFIPNWDEFTAGEWIDIENLCEDFWSNATKIMSILYRPITKRWGERYEIEPYTAKEDHEPFERLSAEYFSGCMLFFSNTRKELLNTTKSSLTEIVERGMISLNDGDGIPSYTVSQVKTSSKWNKFLRLLSGIFSRISHFLKT